MGPHLKSAFNAARKWLATRPNDEGAEEMIARILQAAIDDDDDDPLTLSAQVGTYLRVATVPALSEIADWPHWPAPYDNRDAAILLLLQRDTLSLNSIRKALARHRLSGGKADLMKRLRRLARDKLIRRVPGGRGSGHRWAAIV